MSQQIETWKLAHAIESTNQTDKSARVNYAR